MRRKIKVKKYEMICFDYGEIGKLKDLFIIIIIPCIKFVPCQTKFISKYLQVYTHIVVKKVILLISYNILFEFIIKKFNCKLLNFT